MMTYRDGLVGEKIQKTLGTSLFQLSYKFN